MKTSRTSSAFTAGIDRADLMVVAMRWIGVDSDAGTAMNEMIDQTQVKTLATFDTECLVHLREPEYSDLGELRLKVLYF